MTPAKLFTLAGAGFGIWAMIQSMKWPQPGYDLYLHDVYFVFAHFYVAVAAAAICGIFALFYFGCGWLLRVPLSRGISIAHLLLVVAPLIAFIVELDFVHPNSQAGPNLKSMEMVTDTLLAGAICFLSGCFLFVFNLSRALIRTLRTAR
jgi:heme/copper-type cytochrome/quinol oxidase subunit 1